MTLLESLDDPNLFQPHFPPSWAPWRAFLAAVYASPLDGEGLTLYQRCTGRETPPERAAREVWAIVGRRGGKSRIASLLAVWTAVATDWRPFLAAGEKATVAVVAADRQQARVAFRYITGLIDAVPMLARLVIRRTASAIELQGRVVIEVHTCSFRSVRGYSFAAVIADEVAFWRDEGSASPDVEVVAAIRPGLATLPGSLLIGISSPYSRRGVLWDAYHRHYGRDGDPVLVWQADTVTMHPSLDREIIATAYENDPVAATAEYGAQFRSDLEAFVSREAVEAGTVPGRLGLPPMENTHYVGFCDPSGGSADAFTLAIAHGEERDGTRVVVLDYVSERRPPFSPDAVVAEYAAVCKSYRVATVQADKYAGAWVAEAFRKHGITCDQSAAPKSDLYREMLPLLNSGRVELLDYRRLHDQLLGLERRTARGGRDTIDHAPGAHDDLANAVAGALVACLEPAEPGIITFYRMEVEKLRAEQGRTAHDQ